MATASISETKAKLSALIALVRAGETVTITDRGRPVA
jgi:prevent-host-death family protein